LIAVWAEWLATGCRLNAGDDGLRQRLFVAGFRRGMSELRRAGNEMQSRNWNGINVCVVVHTSYKGRADVDGPGVLCPGCQS